MILSPSELQVDCSGLTGPTVARSSYSMCFWWLVPDHPVIETFPKKHINTIKRTPMPYLPQCNVEVLTCLGLLLMKALKMLSTSCSYFLHKNFLWRFAELLHLKGFVPDTAVYLLFTSQFFKAGHSVVTQQWFTMQEGAFITLFIPSCSNMINYSFIIN